MTAANFPASLAAVLEFEGGWSDDPQDPGGATNHGITLNTWLTYHPGSDATALKAATVDDVAPIFLHGYWNPVRGIM